MTGGAGRDRLIAFLEEFADKARLAYAPDEASGRRRYRCSSSTFTHVR